MKNVYFGSPVKQFDRTLSKLHRLESEVQNAKVQRMQIAKRRADKLLFSKLFVPKFKDFGTL